MPPFARRLRAVVDAAEPRLLALGEPGLTAPRAPGKWSPREELGHLVDSAGNNHQRFVRAMFQDDLVFPGYAQDAWVDAQDYRDAPWTEVVALWAAFNRHIARVMACVPRAERERPRPRHNLHEIAWRTVPPDQPATLAYFMADYVGHLEHHLRNILGAESLPAEEGRP
ncbi:MAG TPA: DinB family protein [Gemmatimonadaceae bacterium]|nr:DinB family protein [Gemmatimonadaceae bacterium]